MEENNYDFDPDQILRDLCDLNAWDDLMEQAASDSNMGDASMFARWVGEYLHTQVLVKVQSVKDMFDDVGYSSLCGELSDWLDHWNESVKTMVQQVAYVYVQSASDEGDFDVRDTIARIRYHAGLGSIACDVDDWVTNQFSIYAEGDEYEDLRNVLREMKVISSKLMFDGAK